MPSSKTSSPLHLIMPLDHRSALASPALMPQLDDPGSTLQKTFEDAPVIIPYCTHQRQWRQRWYKCMGQAFELRWWGGWKWQDTPEEGANESSNDGWKGNICQQFCPSCTEIWIYDCRQITNTMEQMVAKWISTLVVDSLGDILQCPYEKVGMGGRSVVYNVIEKMLFDLLRREVMNKFLDKPIANYFDTSEAVDKISGKLLFTNAFITPIAAIIQRKNKPSPQNSSPRRTDNSWRRR